MPIYEYRCDNGHSFEAFQAMSEEPLTSCEVCDAPAARVLHAPAVHFKGSGFYTTDYARKGAKQPGGEGSGKGEDGGSGSGESKSKSSDSAGKEKAGSSSGGSSSGSSSSGSSSSSSSG
jgi:putative FmdB family regulatory protein